MEHGFWETVGHSLGGPGHLRLVLQPLVAVVVGARLGLADARHGEPPFLWRLLTGRGDRRRLLGESLHQLVIPLCLAVAIDAVVQFLVLRTIRPGPAVVVGLLLVWLPFAAARALTNRAWRLRHRHARA